MSAYYSLTKLLFIDLFSRYKSHLSAQNKWLGKLLLLTPLLLAVPLTQMISAIHDVFVRLGHPELVITYVYVSSLPFMLIWAAPMIMSVFFFSKDLSLLSHLPLNVGSITAAKLTAIYLLLIPISAISLGPAVYCYTLMDGVKPLSLLMGLLAVPLGPIAPLALMMLLVMPLMSLAVRTKRHKLWMISGNLLLIAALLAFMIARRRLALEGSDALFAMMSEGGLLKMVSQGFPPSVWLTRMMEGSFTDALRFVAFQGLTLAVALITSTALYQRALKLSHDGGAGFSKENKRSYTSVSLYQQLIKRHIGIITGNPTFLLNITLSIVFPLVLFVTTSLNGDVSLAMFKKSRLAPFAPLIFTGVLTAPTLLGTLSSTAITREGAFFWETRALPIPAHVNLMSRVYTSDLICLVSAALFIIPSLIVLPISADEALIGVICAAVVTHTFSLSDLLINVHIPYVRWTSPTSAIKNNPNIILALLLRGLMFGLCYLIIERLGITEAMEVIYVIMGCHLILYFISRYLLYPKYLDRFIKLDF